MATSSAEARMEPTLQAGSGNRTGTIEAAAIGRDALGFISNDLEPATAPSSGRSGHHAVADKELTGFLRLGQARSASVSALFLGVLIGFALSVFGIFQQIVSILGLKGMTDILVLAICAICLGISVIAMVLSRRGRTKLTKTIETIRKR